MPTALLNANEIVISDKQREQAKELVSNSPDNLLFNLSIEFEDGETRKLSPALSRLFTSVIHGVANSGRVSLSTIPENLTPSAAANIMGISRPSLMKHIKEGRLPSHKVGSHNRVKADDVFELMRTLHDQRLQIFAELRELSESSGEMV